MTDKGVLGRGRFELRFSARDPDDVRLSWLIAEAMERGNVNMSSVAKRLLLAWFDEVDRTGNLVLPVFGLAGLVGGGTSPHKGDGDEQGEDPSDPLLQQMIGINFDRLGG